MRLHIPGYFGIYYSYMSCMYYVFIYFPYVSLHMRIYVCILMCIYILIYIYIWVYICTLIYIHIFAYVRIRMENIWIHNTYMTYMNNKYQSNQGCGVASVTLVAVNACCVWVRDLGLHHDAWGRQCRPDSAAVIGSAVLRLVRRVLDASLGLGPPAVSVTPGLSHG